MISKYLLKSGNVRAAYTLSIRTKIHPTSAAAEFIHGKSAVGKAREFAPSRTEVEKGKSYAWCSCGASAKQPFCDGSHKKLNAQLKEGETSFAPLRFTCEESRTVFFCMCKGSSNRPFCDGTHFALKKKSDEEARFKI